ncbi:P-II family nitrogen regulator [Halalkalibacter sp. APA_J-10(15)]|uniref:P-II family nitrogen regulator n=1 Tax=unclassified Halalkalibacter TaxID=2893063 RepID=UPI001FF2488E|nr:P-II family nitrogen regulator [Halalkalibacter sp. APA_J-10(15)]MCK0473076.1 P-II family nitrogen regulator [Halalkalibacter sp. APA_J-10(15)]
MDLNLNYSLIITIVKKGDAKHIVKSTKKAGADGGTILLGRGVGIHEKKHFLGIPIEPEKNIILTAVPSKMVHNVIEQINVDYSIDKPGKGLGIVLHIKSILGLCHVQNIVDEKENEQPMSKEAMHFELIVTIVNKGDSEKVVNATKKAGAEGGTIISGRGTGIHERAKLLNLSIEPEKEIILTLISKEKTKQVLAQIEEDVQINQPGKGIGFILDVERTIGIHHLQDELNK